MIKTRREIDHDFGTMLKNYLPSTDISTLDLLRSLGFATHAITHLTDRDLARHNLSLAKLRVLFWLQMRSEDGTEGGGLLPSELSRYQGVTPNTMSSLVTSLRESGLIEQVGHPSDRRKHIIKITPVGRELLNELGPDHLRFLQGLFSGLSEEERQILVTLLHKLIASVRPQFCEQATVSRER